MVIWQRFRSMLVKTENGMQLMMASNVWLRGLDVVRQRAIACCKNPPCVAVYLQLLRIVLGIECS